MICSEKGNSLLEFILYLPIAILLLLASTDFGLHWAEMSALNSALSSGARAAKLSVVKQKLSSQEMRATKITEQTFDHVQQRVSSYKAYSIDRVQDDYAILVRIISAKINQTNGEIDPSSLAVLSEYGDISLSNESLQALNKNLGVVANPQTSLEPLRGYSKTFQTEAHFISVVAKSTTPSLSREVANALFGQKMAETQILLPLEVTG